MQYCNIPLCYLLVYLDFLIRLILRCIDFNIELYPHNHYRFSFNPVSSSSTELAGFRMIIDFTTSRSLSRLFASFIISPFLCISFSTCFFPCLFRPSPFLYDLAIRIIEPFNSMHSLLLKTCWPYHRILLAFAILSKDSSWPNVASNWIGYFDLILFVDAYCKLVRRFSYFPCLNRRLLFRKSWAPNNNRTCICNY